jgi:hypothetical protein
LMIGRSQNTYVATTLGLHSVTVLKLFARTQR